MNAVPGHDHASEWFHPATKAYVYVDEPYLRAVEDRVEERQAWADKYGWAIVRPNWLGMYSPDGGCELYLAADKAKGFDLAAAASALKRLAGTFRRSRLGWPVGGDVSAFLQPGRGSRRRPSPVRSRSRAPSADRTRRSAIGWC